MWKAIEQNKKMLSAEACWEEGRGRARTEPGRRAGPAKRDLWPQTWVGRSGVLCEDGGREFPAQGRAGQRPPGGTWGADEDHEAGDGLPDLSVCAREGLSSCHLRLSSLDSCHFPERDWAGPGSQPERGAWGSLRPELL